MDPIAMATGVYLLFLNLLDWSKAVEMTLPGCIFHQIGFGCGSIATKWNHMRT